MKANRENLLQILQSVQPGINVKETVEQSSCFVFKDGLVMTFNDEVACTRQSGLELEGAVSAEPLLSLLEKMGEGDLELEVGKGELIIAGKRRKAGIRMEAEVLLPIAAVEHPTKWAKLPDDFSDAVEMAYQCASTDESLFNITCVHIHPHWIEATDNEQLIRYMIDTPIRNSTLVKHSTLKHVASLGMTRFCETEAWLHFKNRSGLVFSCRRYLEDFPDLSKFLEVEGHPITLPKGLSEAIEKAEIFSADSPDNDKLLISLKPGRLKIKSTGSLGWYYELKKIKYQGDTLEFQIRPKLLSELIARYNEAIVSQDRLLVTGANFKCVAALEVPGQNGEADDDSRQEDE